MPAKERGWTQGKRKIRQRTTQSKDSVVLPSLVFSGVFIMLLFHQIYQFYKDFPFPVCTVPVPVPVCTVPVPVPVPVCTVAVQVPVCPVPVPVPVCTVSVQFQFVQFILATMSRAGYPMKPPNMG